METNDAQSAMELMKYLTKLLYFYTLLLAAPVHATPGGRWRWQHTTELLSHMIHCILTELLTYMSATSIHIPLYDYHTCCYCCTSPNPTESVNIFSPLKSDEFENVLTMQANSTNLQ